MMKRFFRLIRINFIMMRYNIDEIILGTHQFAPLRFFVYLNPYYWLLRKKMSRGERMRRALEELGPIFVKAGQIISTRRDLLPDDVAVELSLLQDRVPPFPGDQAVDIIENALNAPLHDVFAHFDKTALASASIAQVHAATLKDGSSVVVKVLRPRIKDTIDRDIDLLMTLAKAAGRYSSRARHFKPVQLVEEIAHTLYDELDLLREGANASQLKRNFAKSPLLYIPAIHWAYSRHDILVMERIHGIPVHDIESLKRAKVDMDKLAKRGLEVFFTQVFRDSFFHADLHPGNIFVDTSDPSDPTFIAVDFGITGSLSRDDQRYLAENMVAFFKRDYQRVAELHIACGWLPPETRVDQFEGAIRAVSEPIFEQPLRDISFGKLLLRLFQVARQFQINIQPQLILLQKSLLSIEGLSRQLAPDLDLWTSAAPQIEKWLREQVGFRSFLRNLKDNLPLWSEQLPEIPVMIYEVLKETKQLQESVRFKRTMQRDKKSHRRPTLSKLLYFVSGMIVATLFVMLMK